MSLPLFYAPEIFTAERAAGDTFVFEGPDARHALTVSRLSVGEQLLLIDGRGSRLTATIVSIDSKDRATLETVDLENESRPTPQVTVVQALPKSERSELAVDLATQAGADRIIAWQAERSIAKWTPEKASKHLQRWKNQAISSAKQSRRTFIPEISGPATTADIRDYIDGKTAFILHEEATTRINQVDLAVEEIVIIVGPEGGVSPKELETLGATPVKLGPEIYRTASAAMVALSAIGVLTSRW